MRDEIPKKPAPTKRTTRSPRRLRGRLVLAAKVLLAAALITWMVRSGSLDARSFDVFVQRPLLLVAAAALFSFGVLVGALRWRVLLQLANVHIPLGRALQLQMTSLFFNTVIPGGVGGDVVKAAYAAREAAPAKRPTVFLIVFVERLLGLGGLVVVAGAVILLRGPTVWANPQLRGMALVVAALAAATVLGPAVLVTIVRTSGAHLTRWTRGTSRVAKLAAQLVAAARLLAAGPKNLAMALGLSMTVHAAAMAFFTALAVAITARDIPYSATATVYPLGILTIIVPISPGGIGVGHVAFDRLFAILGISGGASVFNAYLLVSIGPTLLGVFPYLALKRSHVLPTEAEAVAETQAVSTAPP